MDVHTSQCVSRSILAQSHGFCAMLSGWRRYVQLLMLKWGRLVQYSHRLFFSGMLYDGVSS